MNKPLAFAALAEAATGAALVVAPSLVAGLLLGGEPSGVAVPSSRVAGIAIFALAIACWPAKEASPAALCGMTTYSVLVALYLLCVGVAGEQVGPLLWPATITHALLSLLLAREWFLLTRTSGD
jgi:hypothetical protein